MTENAQDRDFPHLDHYQYDGLCTIRNLIAELRIWAATADPAIVGAVAAQVDSIVWEWRHWAGLTPIPGLDLARDHAWWRAMHRMRHHAGRAMDALRRLGLGCDPATAGLFGAIEAHCGEWV